ncbi:MAG TPA: hypothetical protein H9778_06530 [Candidatus Parabacteroides intestinavium]|nr:hypothetical protein [Candidatus Parabacteroides intestinavium]
MSGYTSFDLRKYAETIQTLPLKGLSVSGLESLSRANLAIYHMLISDSLDDIYGNRKKYLARIKKMYALCRSLYVRQDFITSCRMVNLMQSLASVPGLITSRWQDECYNLVWRFVEERKCVREEWNIPEWLWCVACSYYPLSDEESQEESFCRFREQLEKWVAELGRDGQWTGLSVFNGLQRIQVLNGNSYMFLDNSFDDALRSAYRYYRNQVKFEKTTDIGSLRLMGMLYEQAFNYKVYQIDRESMRLAIDALEASLPLLPEKSDVWLFTLSYLVSAECLNIMNRYN